MTVRSTRDWLQLAPTSMAAGIDDAKWGSRGICHDATMKLFKGGIGCPKSIAVEGFPPPLTAPLVRRGKQLRERVISSIGLAAAAPVFFAAAVAIKVEGVFRPNARGPVFFTEARVAQGRIIGMLKFRILTSEGLASLGSGPTHIAHLEQAGELTRVGRVLKQWYLDELPQLINIARGDIGLIGTRPYPVELYLEEMEQGVTRKRDMPAGLIGPVQSHKGDPADPDGVALDGAYWDLYQHASRARLLLEDLRIVARSVRVQLEHKGI